MPSPVYGEGNIAIRFKTMDLLWKPAGAMVRTIRPGVLPSEMIVSDALKNTLPGFLHHGAIASEFRKFILDKIDPTRPESSRFAA